MIRKLLYILAGLLYTVFSLSQEQGTQKDTTSMPKLEIPEITIVGKKAITLPFARKGEIYDVNIYEASPPDTALLGDWFGTSLPIGALPRYEEPRLPWHFSAEGSLGSFSTGHLKAYVDYKSRDWGIYGNGGFSTTNGHTANSSANSIFLQTTSHSIISTDNEILGSFRTSGGFHLKYDKYGMFGIKSIVADRSRSDVFINAQLASLERERNYLALGLSADICSINDMLPSVEHKSSGVSPELYASYRTQLENVRISSHLLYTSSALNYDQPVQTPSLFKFGLGGEWQLLEKWSLNVGVNYFNGSASDGSTVSRVFPFANVKLEIASDRELIFWFNPELLITSYSDYYSHNPYLTRQISLKPEQQPVNFGGLFWYNSENFSIELKGSITISKNRSIYVSYADSMAIDYVDANVYKVQASGLVKPIEDLKIKYSGIFQPSLLKSSNHQLPMIPLIQIGGIGEYNLKIPLTLWSSVEYWSNQNVDYSGDKTLKSRFLLGIGAYTDLIPKTILSFEISNLFNQSYQWWYNYIAPGRFFKLEAKVNIQ